MRRFFLLLVGAGLLVGCRTTEPVVDPDTVFGHRFDEVDPEGHRTLPLQPPVEGDEHFVYPAIVNDIMVRVSPAGPGAERPVELLLLGRLPDGCTHLHSVTESRTGHLLDVELQMWRPKGATCAQVVRPYRFYYELTAPLAPGSYTLRLNDAVHPFQVHPEVVEVEE